MAACNPTCSLKLIQSPSRSTAAGLAFYDVCAKSTASRAPRSFVGLWKQRHTHNKCSTVKMSLHGGSFHAGGSEEEYMQAVVLDAVAMQPSKDQLYMMMANGTKFEVNHVNPMAGKLLFKDMTPTMILKLIDNENVMLPIVVGGPAMALLLQGLRHEASTRPNCYDLMMEMIKSLDHEIFMVKIEQRVVDTYFARLYVCKRGTSEYGASFSIDARPSDAINLAVRCNVPIFVHRSIVLNDAVQLRTSPIMAVPAAPLDTPATKYYSPSNQPDMLGEELSLVTKLMTAVNDERYNDAAELRDQLTQLRQGSWRKV